MANLQGFDANTVEPSKAYEALPPGDYLAVICDSEMRPIKSGQGEGLNLTFEVMDGEFKGRRMWTFLNLVNVNPKVKEIAERDLSAICYAVHVLKPADSMELHNIPLIVTMVRDRNERERTVPKGYKAVGDAPAVTRQAPTRPATPVARTAPAAPPWQRTTATA